MRVGEPKICPSGFKIRGVGVLQVSGGGGSSAEFLLKNDKSTNIPDTNEGLGGAPGWSGGAHACNFRGSVIL